MEIKAPKYKFQLLHMLRRAIRITSDGSKLVLHMLVIAIITQVKRTNNLLPEN
jgi:hypothetical protein